MRESGRKHERWQVKSGVQILKASLETRRKGEGKKKTTEKAHTALIKRSSVETRVSSGKTRGAGQKDQNFKSLH